MNIKSWFQKHIIWPMIVSAVKGRLKMLKGYRTYLSIGVGIIITGIFAMGYIDEKTYAAIAGICTMLGIGFTRAAKK